MKTQPFSSFRSVFQATLFCLIIGLTLVAFNKPPLQTSSDEQAIRDIVDQLNKTGGPVPYTDDRIFWSGAYPRPIIGKISRAEDKKLDEQMQKERLNFKGSSKIERLVVAKSGDIAYEYGKGTLSWDTPDKKHVQFDNAYLRAWKKVDNQWKVDAMFARPLDSDVSRPKNQ